MFGKKKEEKPKRNHSGRNLAQYGLFDLPTDLTFNTKKDAEEGSDDSDLEAELLALSKDSEPIKPQRKPKQKQIIPETELNAMVASSLKDVPSDEDLSDDGEDDDDPDLLNELQELTQDEAQTSESTPAATTATEPEPELESNITKLLHERLKMYETAEEIAKKTGESGRARRFNRGIKTLKDLIKQANSGRPINPDDIPPEVSVNPVKKPTTPVVETNEEESPKSDQAAPIEPSPSKPKPPVDQETLAILNERKTQYRLAALQSKKSGDVTTAVAFMKMAKQFEAVLKAVENGEPVDLTDMPGPPNEQSFQPQTTDEKKEENETQQNPTNVEDESSETQEEQLITAGSVAEALQQRLEVYKKQEENATTEGNSGKARRMGRIVKQFEQAIKQHAAGKPVPIDELPTPPGYAPIQIDSSSAPSTVPVAVPKPTPTPTPNLPEESNKPTPPPRTNSAYSRIEKLVTLLLKRQKEFKEAAIEAKRKGEIAQAKELLRTAMGFDKVINAARGGLPVDMNSLPIPPKSRSVLDESFEVVLADECVEDDTGHLDMLTRLEDQLTKQLKMCISTRDHHKAIGDVVGVNRFENLALTVTRDLDVVRLAHRTNDEVPKFHYENKSFSIVKYCTDLNDNDLELVIIRGINYNCPNPKDVDTYVRFEFPFPQDEGYKERTAVIKNTNSPEYNATFTIPIQRTSRQCLRVFKRHGIKMEVLSKGGFLRSDQLLGTVTVKIQPLETQCELHDSFDLMDGRKKVGGKLEVHLRVRHPLVAEQVEKLNEKWLILDH